MTRILLIFAFIASSLSAQELTDTLLKDVASIAAWRPGEDVAPLTRVEAFAFTLPPAAPARASLENALGEAFTKAGSREAKTFLGKMLRVVGTEACIPAVEQQLTNPTGSHAARLVLGHLASPKAGAALHRALNKSDGLTRAGIINSLGECRHTPALEDLSTYLMDPDAAAATLSAIGKIGGNEAVAILRKANPTPEARIAHEHALLRAAERADADVARRVYEQMAASDESRLQLAGLTGLVRVAPDNASGLLTAAMKGDDALLSATAVSLLAETDDADTTKQFAAMLKDLPASTQIPVLRALATRGDNAAVDAVMERLKNGEEPVRLAAIDAIVALGNGTHVPELLRIAAGGAGQQQARAGLLRMKALRVNDALVLAASDGDPGERIEAIRAAAGRSVKGIGKQMLTMSLNDSDDKVRREAIRSLAKLANPNQLEQLVAAAANPKVANESAGFVFAIQALQHRGGDAEALATIVINRLSRQAAPGLVRLLSVAGTQPALAAAQQQANSGDEAIRDAAVRSLADWPSPAAAPALLDLAQTGKTDTHKTLALRGYVRLAEQAEDPEAMFLDATKVARTPAELKTVLGGLAGANSAQALQVVAGYLENEAVRDEAAIAAIEIAGRMKNADEKLIRSTMGQIGDEVEDKGIRKRAQDVVNAFEKYDGYIFSWQHSPIYEVKGKDAKQHWETALGPEVPKETVNWKPITKGFNNFACDLGQVLGNKDNVLAYVRTTIIADEAQEARLELGSDDSVKAWLNGSEIHKWFGSRGTSPGSDVVKVQLKKGPNDLMLKIVNVGGGWGFAARVRQPDGSALPGLAFEAK